MKRKKNNAAFAMHIQTCLHCLWKMWLEKQEVYRDISFNFAKLESEISKKQKYVRTRNKLTQVQPLHTSHVLNCMC